MGAIGIDINKENQSKGTNYILDITEDIPIRLEYKDGCLALIANRKDIQVRIYFSKRETKKSEEMMVSYLKKYDAKVPKDKDENHVKSV